MPKTFFIFVFQFYTLCAARAWVYPGVPWSISKDLTHRYSLCSIVVHGVRCCEPQDDWTDLAEL